MAHGTSGPRRSGKERYYSPGPAPRTKRGKRRHQARGPQAKAHAANVWIKHEN